MPDEIIITDLTDDSLATTIAEVPQLVEVVPVGSDQELSSLPLAKRAAEERPLQDGHPEAAAELGDSSSSSSSTIMVPSSLGSVDENISASRTLTNRKQSASLFPNINFPINDTTSAALPATNTSAATTAPPPLPNPLSCNSAQILLMQLMLQWKENKAHIDDLMRKSQDLSRIIQDSIEPNEAVVKMREKEKENQMLQLLVRQYESTLDIVMKKFRTQTSIIHDKKYREQSELEVSLEQEREENARLKEENTMLQTQLEECTKAMREALSSLDLQPAQNPSVLASSILSKASSTETTIFKGSSQRRMSQF